jgi:8-oxo-dGTP diphosphatase
VNTSTEEVLLLKRKGAHAEGTWAAPGGWIDFEDESPEEAAVREVGEEVGLLCLENPKLLTAVSENHKDLGVKSVTLYYAIAYDEVRGIPYPMEPHKASELGWFKLNELPSPLFPKLGDVLKIR